MWFFIVLILSTIVGVLIAQDPGYALFSYANWTMEMPLWLVILILVAVAELLFILISFTASLMRIPQRIKVWYKIRALKLSEKQIEQGLLAQDYEERKDWPSLLKLLPRLQKGQILNTISYESLELKTYLGKMIDAKSVNESVFQQCWSGLPRRLKLNPRLVKSYVEGLIEYKLFIEAEVILRSTLNKIWDEDLIYLYGTLKVENPQKLLKQVEKWRDLHPDSAFLLLSLGRLCLEAQLWGMAREYLERSLKIQNTAEGYLALGQLLEQLNLLAESKHCYKQGILNLAKMPAV